MTKKPAGELEAANGAKRKKPAAKKPAAPSGAGAKKAGVAQKGGAAKKPARGGKKKPGTVDTRAAMPQATPAGPGDAVSVAGAEPPVIEDAQILAETPAFVEAPEPERAEPAPVLTEEEQQLQALYGGDLDKPATAHGEYSDRQTADEDRPMLPEINARDERKSQWQDRRDQRRRRRDQRNDRGPRPGGDQPQGQGPRPPMQSQQGGQGDQRRDQPRQDQRPAYQSPRPEHRAGQGPTSPMQPPMQPPVATNGHDHDALGRVGTPLGDAAATVFAQLRNGQPLPVRQLAQMMRKRNLIEIDPDQVWQQLKAELLGDERSYRTLGLRPRIVYRGRDLFAPGPVAMSVTAEAESGVAAALSRLAGATHRALASRIAKASPLGFERLIHAYLVAAGYRDIAWVKRIGGISYASATAPGIDRTVLISARSGEAPIDRRGIGELRVGVEAKDLVAGILMSPSELSEDAEKELERAGRSIAVICGVQLVAALIASGVGVVSAAAPLRYVDDQLLDELLAG